MKTEDGGRRTEVVRRKAGEGSPTTDHCPPSTGFSLIEVLVAVTILALAFTVIWRTFAATIDGWQRGSAFLERLHTGDYVIEQLVSALRSAAYFPSKPSAYGFWLESKGGAYPSDEISWVTSSSAFLPSESPHANALHRLSLSIDSETGGSREGLLVKAWPHLADLDETEPEEWFISSRVKGVECKVYNPEVKDWESEWEDTNSLPRLVRITVYLEPDERYTEAVKLSRLVEIPMAELAGDRALRTELNQAPAPEGGGQPAPQPAESTQVRPGQEAVPP